MVTYLFHSLGSATYFRPVICHLRTFECSQLRRTCLAGRFGSCSCSDLNTKHFVTPVDTSRRFGLRTLVSSSLSFGLTSISECLRCFLCFSSCCKLTNNDMHTQHFWEINSDCGNYQPCGASVLPFIYDLWHHVFYFALAVIGYLYDRGENEWRVGHRWVLLYLYLGL